MAKKPKKDDKAPVKDAPADNAKATNAEDAQGPMLRILAQYLKDSSFENPNAPNSLRAGLEAPGIDLNVEVKGAPVDDNTAEVTLLISAKASRGNDVAFICELEYSGLFALANIGPEQMQAIMLIECPRLLFPFARQIMAELTQQGGFPPLMLEPLDFAQLYRQQGGGQEVLN